VYVIRSKDVIAAIGPTRHFVKDSFGEDLEGSKREVTQLFVRTAPSRRAACPCRALG
jgi:hypothetical protein